MLPQEWSLLTIAAAGGRALQPVQLQKALFLMGQNISKEQLQVEAFYAFVPYDYGPFCEAIYYDAEMLEALDFVHIARPPETRFKEYRATQRGLAKASELRVTLDPAVATYVGSVVEFVRSLSFNQLVSSIYKNYPEMKANSVFRD